MCIYIIYYVLYNSFTDSFVKSMFVCFHLIHENFEIQKIKSYLEFIFILIIHFENESFYILTLININTDLSNI